MTGPGVDNRTDASIRRDLPVHNIAVVGCGNISGMHFIGALAHPERAKVVSVCDPAPERLESARRTYGVERAFTSLGDMLDAGGWNTAVVCTPSHIREEIVGALAAAGKNVLVEKPLSDKAEQAQRIVDACETAGVLLAVNQNFRDHYGFGIAREVLDGGAVGQILGIAHQDLMFRQDKGWRIQTERHSLSVMGVHWFDGFRYLLPHEATSVSCRTYSSPAVDCIGDTDAFVQMFFGDASVSYVQSFSSRVKRTETIVLGDEGTLEFGYSSVALVRHDGTASEWNNPCSGEGKPESAYRSLARLFDALDLGGEPSNSGRDNLKTIALLEAAYQSSQQQRPISLEVDET